MMKKMSHKELSRQARWLIFSKGRLVVATGESAPPVATFDSFPFLQAYASDVHELPPLDDSPAQSSHPTYVVDMGSERIEEDDWQAITLREVLMNTPVDAFSMVGRAWQYVHFLRTHRFCGQCGSPMEQVDWEMAMHCHQCHHRCYPRVSPCIIVAIHDNEKLLLARGVRHRDANMYSTLAGFVESGESLEEAIHREVYEEVGVRVKNIEYFGSQPWPFPHSLMVGYIAEYAGGEIVPEENEIDDAQWFSLDDLPKIPPKLSIAGQLIEAAIDKLKKQA